MHRRHLINIYSRVILGGNNFNPKYSRKTTMLLSFSCHFGSYLNNLVAPKNYSYISGCNKLLAGPLGEFRFRTSHWKIEKGEKDPLGFDIWAKGFVIILKDITWLLRTTSPGADSDYFIFFLIFYDVTGIWKYTRHNNGDVGFWLNVKCEHHVEYFMSSEEESCRMQRWVEFKGWLLKQTMQFSTETQLLCGHKSL